jgi:5-dehydro-2-deoxygluconokinase
VFDIDYRPNLWGLAGHAAGFERYVKSDYVTSKIKPVLADCDLIVGTEEEVLVAGGESDLLAALKAIRAAVFARPWCSSAAPRAASSMTGLSRMISRTGIVGHGFPIEIYNVLGAGDAFMSGFLRGWLRGEDHATSATWANACGAFAVSRLLCAPEYPSWTELSYFLEHGSTERALRKDEALNHLHWATTRRKQWPKLMALAIDHRKQLEDIAGAATDRIPAFKRLAVQAAVQVAGGRPGFGMLLDDKWGREALFDAPKDFWIARPLELPGSRPLEFEFSADVGSRIAEWPVDHVLKVLCFWHPDDLPSMKSAQLGKLRTAYEAARKVGRDILIEVIASKAGPVDGETAARALGELYDAGLKPDWWKLEPQIEAGAWDAIDQVIETRDPYCRGVVMLGLEAPQDELARAFTSAKRSRTVRGFAVGRTIFAEPAKAWFAGAISDGEAVTEMAERFGALVEIWEG